MKYVLNTKIELKKKKNDGSPLSIADLEVDNIIRGNLNNYDPSIKILSEENEFSLNSYLEECYWIIDPIDGTQSYISEGNEYTINIALIYQ